MKDSVLGLVHFLSIWTMQSFFRIIMTGQNISEIV